MITAYLRVSTDKQDTENQKHHIQEYCRENNLMVDSWIDETITGRKKFRHRKIWYIIEHLEKGDIIIVSEMSRIGRDMLDSIRLLIECIDAGASLISVQEDYKLTDDPMVKFWGIMNCFRAEMEVAEISNRTKKALARKKKEGVTLGRRKGRKSDYLKLDPYLGDVERMLSEGCAKKDIALSCGVSRVTLNRFIKERGLSR